MLSEYAQVMELHRVLAGISRARKETGGLFESMSDWENSLPSRAEIESALLQTPESRGEFCFSWESYLRNALTKGFQWIVLYSDFYHTARSLSSRYSYDLIVENTQKPPFSGTWSLKLNRDLLSHLPSVEACSLLSTAKNPRQVAASVEKIWSTYQTKQLVLNVRPLDPYIKDLANWISAWRERKTLAADLHNDIDDPLSAASAAIDALLRATDTSYYENGVENYDLNSRDEDEGDNASDDSYTDYFSPQKWRYAWGTQVDEQKRKSMPERTWSDHKKKLHGKDHPLSGTKLVRFPKQALKDANLPTPIHKSQ